MILSRDFKPKPSDFGNFVYCRKEWYLKHKKPLKPKEKDQNEDKCIKWVCNKERVTEKQIFFNGTGEDNPNSLTSEIESVSMPCKPDLIINKDGRILLYEFKEVKEPRYLDLYEFDSVHAQVWCYTKLKEIKINEYYLLRYFQDPNCTFGSFSPRRYSNKPYCHRRLTSNELNPDKFNKIFKEYIEIVKLFKLKEHEIRELFLHDIKVEKMLRSIWTLPKDEDLKCSKCIRRIKGYCHLYKP